MKDRENFVEQAGFLAVAGIISRIIGLLYRSPITSIIGDEGNGYYNYAINIYSIILLVASYSIPSAISKIVSEKLALREYRNAHRIFRCALIYVAAVGTAASLFAYFAAPVLVVRNAVPVLRVFAPTIFVSGFCGVFRGYFQAHKSMIQTSLSQILEQIMNALASIIAAYLLTKPYAAGTTERAVHGALGSALGTGAGVLTALLFMYYVYRLNKSFFSRQMSRDTTGKEDSYKDIFRLLISIVTPFILSTCIYNLSTALNQTIYTKIMINAKGMTQEETASLYGIFGTKAVTLVNVPIAISSAISAALMPGISGAYARKKYQDAGRRVNSAVHMSMLIAIPSAAGMFVLSKPVMQLIFPQKNSLDTASKLLCALSVTIVFYSLSTLSNAVLQGIGKVKLPVYNAAASLVFQCGVLSFTLMFTDMNLYALVLSNVIYSFMMCILNGICVRKALNVHADIMKIYIKPLICSAVMSVLALGVYKGLHFLVKSNALSVVAAVAAACFVYFIMLLKTKAMTEEDMLSLRGGSRLLKFARKIGISAR